MRVLFFALTIMSMLGFGFTAIATAEPASPEATLGAVDDVLAQSDATAPAKPERCWCKNDFGNGTWSQCYCTTERTECTVSQGGCAACCDELSACRPVLSAERDRGTCSTAQ